MKVKEKIEESNEAKKNQKEKIKYEKKEVKMATYS